MIKLKDLLFEQTKTEQLPVVRFDKNFANNYITVTGDWKVKANQVIKQIQDELAKGKKLEDLTIKIHGGASDVPATNGYRGTNPPNHNFQTVGVTTGGLLPGGKWEPVYKDRANIGEPQGNNFLANARAEALKAKLVPYISRGVGAKPNIEVIADPVTGTSLKFANAVVTSAVKPFIKPPKYVIQYPWYGLKTDDNLVLVDGNIASSWRENKAGSMSTKWYQSTLGDKNILYSGFQKTGVDSLQPGAFIRLNASSYTKTFAIYEDEKSWLADVKKMTRYASGTETKELRMGNNTSKKILPGYRGAEGYLDRSGSSQYMGYAQFKMRSKDRILSPERNFYLIKPAGDQAKYISDLFPPRGASRPQTGALMSNGEKSAIVGNQFSSDNPNAITYSEVVKLKTMS